MGDLSKTCIVRLRQSGRKDKQGQDKQVGICKEASDSNDYESLNKSIDANIHTEHESTEARAPSLHQNDLGREELIYVLKVAFDMTAGRVV